MYTGKAESVRREEEGGQGCQILQDTLIHFYCQIKSNPLHQIFFPKIKLW